MKAINHPALAAFAFGLLTLGTTVNYAGETTKVQSCRRSEQSCCGSDCCKATSQERAFASDQNAERYKAKYGREFPIARTKVQSTRAPSRDGCCKNCC